MIEARRKLAWRGVSTLLVGVVLAAATGCGDDPAPSNDEPEGEVTMKLLGRSKFCRREEPALLAVRTADEWSLVWADAMSETTVGHRPPAVDFTRYMVLAAFLGEGAAGRDVSIGRVEIQAGKVVVTWIKRDGSAGGDGRRSSPYYLVRIPKSRHEVVWQEAESR